MADEPGWIMVKKVNTLAGFIIAIGTIIASSVTFIWIVATYMNNIDVAVKGHTTSIAILTTAVENLKGQMSDFEKKVTGTPSQPRPIDGHH